VQSVCFENRKARFFVPSVAKVCGERHIELYRGYAVGKSQQALGEGTASWADFDNELRVITTRSTRDALESLAFDEEMLAEFLARQGCGAF
jgi:hypothetical protein